VTDVNRTFSVPRLVLGPGFIALAVTLLRLTGELVGWPRPLVNRDVCGKAILGVVWLVPIFGVYFAAKLLPLGYLPARLGRSFAYAAVGLALKLAGTALIETPGIEYATRLIGNLGLTTAGLVLTWLAWPQLFKLLLAYGYASRLPVIVVQFLAMRGHWGTHYDALDPDFPLIGFWATFIRTSLVPNIFFMEVYTVVVGLLFGLVWAFLTRRRMAAPPVGTTPQSPTIEPRIA
jgi:hypothetical protein